MIGITREQLQAAVVRASREELPGLVGILAAAQAEALARLTAQATAQASPAATRAADVTEDSLTAAAAARRIGVSVSWLYKNHKAQSAERVPCFRIGRRVVFSARAIDRWKAARGRA